MNRPVALMEQIENAGRAMEARDGYGRIRMSGKQSGIRSVTVAAQHAPIV